MLIDRSYLLNTNVVDSIPHSGAVNDIFLTTDYAGRVAVLRGSKSSPPWDGCGPTATLARFMCQNEGCPALRAGWFVLRTHVL